MTRRLAANPKSLTVRAALARLYRRPGALMTPRRVTRSSCRRVQPTSPPFSASQKSPSAKKFTEATDYITRARTAAPNDPAPGLLLVNMYGLQQDWKQAASAAAELVSQFPTNVDVLDARGRVQIAARDTDGALDLQARPRIGACFQTNLVPLRLFAQRGEELPRGADCVAGRARTRS